MGAIKREMNNTKWFWIAIGYQCGYAYLVGLVINQIAGLITGDTAFNVFTVIAILIIVPSIIKPPIIYHLITLLHLKAS